MLSRRAIYPGKPGSKPVFIHHDDFLTFRSLNVMPSKLGSIVTYCASYIFERVVKGLDITQEDDEQMAESVFAGILVSDTPAAPTKDDNGKYPRIVSDDLQALINKTEEGLLRYSYQVMDSIKMGNYYGYVTYLLGAFYKKDITLKSMNSYMKSVGGIEDETFTEKQRLGFKYWGSRMTDEILDVGNLRVISEPINPWFRYHTSTFSSASLILQMLDSIGSYKELLFKDLDTKVLDKIARNNHNFLYASLIPQTLLAITYVWVEENNILTGNNRWWQGEKAMQGASTSMLGAWRSLFVSIKKRSKLDILESDTPTEISTKLVDATGGISISIGDDVFDRLNAIIATPPENEDRLPYKNKDLLRVMNHVDHIKGQFLSSTSLNPDEKEGSFIRVFFTEEINQRFTKYVSDIVDEVKTIQVTAVAADSKFKANTQVITAELEEVLDYIVSRLQDAHNVDFKNLIKELNGVEQE